MKKVSQVPSQSKANSILRIRKSWIAPNAVAFSLALSCLLALVFISLGIFAHAQDDELEDELDQLTNEAASGLTTSAPKASTNSQKTNQKTDKIAEPKSSIDAIQIAPSSDEPNAAFEERLAKIYEQHSAPVSSEKWSELIGAKAQEAYSVQNGDTLWDLSSTLFGDGFYWSKLWAENPEIHNPHRIEKGQALRFIGGSENSAPELRVVDDDREDVRIEADGKVGQSGEGSTEASSIAPAQDSPKPFDAGNPSSSSLSDSAESGSQVAKSEMQRLARNEPDLLTIQANRAFERPDVVPAIKDVKEDQVSAGPGVEIGGRGSLTPRGSHVNEAPYFQEDLVGKISQADLDSGVVIEQSEIVPRPQLPPPAETRKKVLKDLPLSFAEKKKKLVDKTVEIKRRVSVAESVPGAIVPSYMAVESVQDPMGIVAEVDAGENVASLGQYVFVKGNEALSIGKKYYTVTDRYSISSRRSGRIGRALEIGGILEIRELVDDVSKVYRAQIVYAVNPVRKDSLVYLGTPPRVPVSTRGHRNSGELTVIAGAFSDERRHFADESIVFLDRGDTEVKVGDVLAVQGRRGERKISNFPDITNPIAIIKVYAVSGKAVSAIVVVATEEIKIGDKTGPEFPSRLPDLKVVAPKVSRLSGP